MIKVAEGQKVQLEEGRFATITSGGTLIIEYTGEGPLGQDRVRVVGISTVGAQALLDLLANGEAVEQMRAADECQEPCELGGVHEFAPPVVICSKCGTRR